MHEFYENPLCGRYADEEMKRQFSDDNKFSTWRRLWLALAESEQELGLSISDEQLDEMRAHIDDIDYAAAAAHEHEVRHDVMAHVLTFGECCPKAKPIIHLGATSCYVTDNADLILYRDALRYLRGELQAVLANLAAFARRYAATPALGYTHYQPPARDDRQARGALDAGFPRRPRGVGLRAGHDALSRLPRHDGTEASFMDLFEGDGGKDRRDEPPHRRALRL